MNESSIKLEDLLVRSNQSVSIRSGESLYENSIINLRPKTIDDLKLKKRIGMDKSVKLNVLHEYVRMSGNIDTPLLFDRKKLLELDLDKL